MSAHTNPKTLIINLLKNNISVEDDLSQAVTGIVAGTWYSKRVLGTHKWMVTVGPTLNANLAPNALGAPTWGMSNVLVVNIWVPILENLEYRPERMRFSLKEEVKRLLMAKLVDPAGDIRFLHLKSWMDIDDIENDMLRIELTIEVEWEE